MPRSVKLGLVQMQMSEVLSENLEKALALTRDAAEQGAEVVCLPELFLSHYFCKTESTEPFAMAEAIPGPTTRAFEDLAAEKDIAIVVSLFEKRTEGLYHNTAAVIDGSRGYIGKYRKMHIPDDPLFYEKYYFAPGDLGFKNFETDRANLGVLICWDQWYPEAARLTAIRGAEVLFYPTAIGWHRHEKATHGEAQRDAWITSQRAHAIANGCFVVSVNRIGFEATPGATDPDDGIEFWGSSFVVAPDGRILKQASTDQEEILIVDASLGSIAEQRHGWPFLRDRRIDAYDGIEKRFID